MMLLSSSRIPLMSKVVVVFAMMSIVASFAARTAGDGCHVSPSQLRISMNPPSLWYGLGCRPSRLVDQVGDRIHRIPLATALSCPFDLLRVLRVGPWPIWRARTRGFDVARL